VSDALDGIPMRLALRILDEACAPIPNAIVEIWHTNQLGIYSGNINTMCNSAAEDRAAMYFRGYQRTDANGRVDFNTCFPGWYRGRAVHIHLRVMTGEYNAADNAAASVITQLVFSDDLVREVFSQVPLYAAHGQPDTTNATDNVVGGIADRAPYIADVQRLPNGAMLASKTFIVKNATSTSTVCTAGR
jgi:protocatechuate 3,4-dioxygenase beta subunit